MSGIYGKSERRFQVLIHIVLILMAAAAIIPLWVLVMGSITSEEELIQNGYALFPKQIEFSAYEYLIRKSEQIVRSYGVTLFITVVGTGLSLIITPLLAYPLSRKDFKARNIFSFFVFFTMLFNGGIVPSYIMWTQIFQLKNTIWALIFPGLLMNGFNIVLMKNYFSQNIPTELIEAAKVDGANEFKIFYKVVLPMSQPVLATVGLFVGIGYWNDWTNGLYYVNKPELYSLQNYLNRVMQDIQFLMAKSEITTGGDMMASFPSISIRMAIAVVGILPIMVLYPYFQKYFIKGISIGAIKG